MRATGPAMLVELSIRNFAIIEDLRLTFEGGFNALTGETGAGKSIIIDALGAVLGERVGSDVVRSGAKSALVEAIFDVSGLMDRDDVKALFDETGVEPEDGAVMLAREITASGRSVARLNGRATTAAMLSRCGALLVDIHGQSEHLSLLRPSEHLEILDRYAGCLDQRHEVARLVRSLRDVRGRIDDLLTGARDRAQRTDLLHFQTAEIEAAGLRDGEEEELVAERTLLLNATRLATDASGAYATLAGSDEFESQPRIGALALLQQALAQLKEIETLDPGMADTAAKAADLQYQLEDVIGDVRDYRDKVEADPGRLETVDERLDEMRQLKRKYGPEIADVIAFGQRVDAELEALTGGASDVDALRREESGLVTSLSRLAAELSDARTTAAERLGASVERAIAELNMGRARFVVSVTQTDDARGLPAASHDDGSRTVAFDELGIDRVRFMMATNAGETLKPLARVASGGETARLMLALKSILADADSTPTLVFDEVDVGVGGRSGQVVGEKLWGLSTSHQVLVITHLAQIAAFADVHFRIRKEDRAERTVSTVERIDGADRIDEIAFMLDGVPATDESRANARKLVERIETWKADRP